MTNARRGPLSLRPVDLVSVVEETTVQLRNHPKTAGRSIELEASPGQALVGGDRERLKQVFLNLGMNAIEATDPSSGQVKFSVRFQEALAQNRRRAGERRMVSGVEVAVEDNGAGMRPETQAMAFMPFFTTKDSGHGLGLAIVHRIVRDHLGRVDIESTPGSGSRFKVWFPLARAEDAVEERREEVAHAL
jgi:signal transduction histidine kinase